MNKSERYLHLPPETERTGALIVNAAYQVHRELGPGLLEKIYERCFCYELEMAGLDFQRQVQVPYTYKGLKFDDGLRIDVIVENSIICELKAVDNFNPVWQAQVLSYMKMTKIRLGYVLNFNAVLMKHGIHRYIL